MARFQFKGLEQYEKKLSRISSVAAVSQIIGQAIYKGADIMADAIRKTTEALPEVASSESSRVFLSNRKHGSGASKLRGVTSAQKKGLLDGLGITPMNEENGYYDRKIGFDGYNDDGQANVLIARSVNSGTSFREKIPFVDQAVRQARPEVEQAMAKEFDRLLKEVWEGD